MISVVIPTLNVANYVEDAVWSVLQQRKYVKEVILVDNGSTDGTRELCQTLCLRHKDLIRYYEEPSLGAPFARNTGLRYATGEWIQFLDADDILLADKFVRQLRLVEQMPEAPFIAGAPTYQNLAGQRTSLTIPTDVWLALMSGRLGNTTSTLFSRKHLIFIDGWDTSLSSVQDHYLLFELLKLNDKIPIDHHPVSIWRQRTHGQITGSRPAETAFLNIRLREQILNFLRTQRYSYYLEHYDSLALHLYLYLRKLATYDLKTANKYYLSILGDGYRLPLRPDSRIKTPLWVITRILGFYRTEYIRISIKRLLSPALWKRIKDKLK